MLGMLPRPTGVATLESQLCFRLQLSPDVHLESSTRWLRAEVPATSADNWIGFCVPGLGLAQPQLFRNLGRKNLMESMFLSLSLSNK